MSSVQNKFYITLQARWEPGLLSLSIYISDWLFLQSFTCCLPLKRCISLVGTWFVVVWACLDPVALASWVLGFWAWDIKPDLRSSHLDSTCILFGEEVNLGLKEMALVSSTGESCCFNMETCTKCSKIKQRNKNAPFAQCHPWTSPWVRFF